MLLLEIEQTIKPLPRVAKIQLIQAIAEMLKAETDDVARDFQPGQENQGFVKERTART